MRDKLVRFGVAMEDSLLAELDAIVDARGGTRSEAIRDLVRAEVSRTKARSGVDAVAALTLVYDHHVRDLTDKLTETQHALGDKVRSTMHVHLDHDYCLEVVVMRGRADDLARIADKLLATRGVKQGGIEIITDFRQKMHSHGEYAHAHDHDDDGEHAHDHGAHDHDAHDHDARDHVHAAKAAPKSSRARANAKGKK